MHRFFQATSVAVVGVSNTPGNLGRAMAYNLMEFGYNGYIYLVGPKMGAFLGHKIHSSVLDIPGAVEMATILVPASAVPGVLRQCGEKGIERVVVQSAGFGELGEERIPLEEEIRSVLKQYGMRMIGPNCIGVMNRHTGLAVPFMPLKAEAPPGRVAVVSQSGGVGAMMFNALTTEQIGFSKFASIGNKLDVNEADLLEYLILDDKETDVIFCYLEGIADGRRLMEIAQRSEKPIVMHKSNRSAQGAAIARSHSASLSTDDAVVDAAFEQCGIVRVFDQQEAMEGVKAFLLPRMKGNRLGIISRSGGHAVMAADAAEECGFHLPPYPEALTRLVHEHSRAKVIQTHNPLDLGDLFDFDLYRTLVEKALALNEIDGLVFIQNYQGVFDAEESRRLLASLGGVIAGSEKPVAVCVFTSKFEMDRIRKMLDYPVFTDPREAIRSLALNRDRHGRRIPAFSDERPPGVNLAGVQAELDSLSQGPIPAHNLARILAAYGIRLVPWWHAQSEDAAVAAAVNLSFPVALKTAQPEVLHKSDAGGVYLGLADESSVRTAYRELSRLGPAVLVQTMAEPGLEWFVGGRHDRQFGPVVVSGPGGIYVEILRETGIRVGPVSHGEAARLLDESRAAALLSGVRGRSKLDRSALIDIVVRTSWLLEDFPQIQELDLNPVHVLAEGCYALDWRASKGWLQ